MAKEDISDNSLGRKDILRGFDSFKNVFDDHRSVSSDNFVIYIQQKIVSTIDLKSPSCSKAGFIISKKKVRNAVHRNKLKRYLREIYRMNKPAANDLTLIVSFSDIAVAEYMKTKKLDLEKLKPEFKILMEKI